jgi:hypothetical protein
MAYLGDTYRLFKDTVSKNEKEIITLMRVHMKRCIRQYHALIPQLDLIANQWGVSIEDFRSLNNFGSPKSEKNAGRGKLIKKITNTQNTLDLDNNHLGKLMHRLQDLWQGALNRRRPRRQPTKATPSWVHRFLNLRTSRRALNKKRQPQQQILHEL